MIVPQPEAFPLTLPEGRTVLLRQVLPEDKERLRVGLRQLSPQSRYLRFFSSVDHLNEQQLDYLTNPDQIDHVAWGALDPTDPGHPGLGIGRFVRQDDPPDSAEMAIAIADDFQHRGLGTVLLGVLYLLAGIRGIKSLQGILLPENRAVFHGLQKIGAELTRQGNLFQLALPVHQNLSRLPATPSGEKFRKLLDDLNTQLGLGASI